MGAKTPTPKHRLRVQGERLTEKERRSIEYKRQVLRYAEEHQRKRAELEGVQEYRMPAAYDAEGGVRQVRCGYGSNATSYM